MGLTGLKITVSARLHSFWLSGRMRFLALSASRGHLHSLACGPSCLLQCQWQQVESSSHHISLPFSVSLFHSEGPCDDAGPTRMISPSQIN